MPEIEDAGASLIAVSPETPKTTEDLVLAKELNFPVLSDRGAQVADSYGLVFALAESLRPIYAEFGIDIPASNGDDTFKLPLAATYVIRQDGTIAWAHVSSDYTTRAEPSDILDALNEL